MTLYESMDLAKKFGDGKIGITEASDAQQPDKTARAVDVVRHLAEAKPAEDKPVVLGSLPLPN